MAGRRLLDVAKLFNASRSIAKQHFAIRKQQWDVFAQTSEPVKAIKNQTDRVTLTARAAYALSRRVNETGPSYTSNDVPSWGQPQQAAYSQQQTEPIPRQETVQGSGSVVRKEEGLKQDHHYKRSEQNAAAEPPTAEEELDVTQKKADRYPLPDGTILPKDAQVGASPSSQGKDTFTGRPTVEPTKDLLTEDKAAGGSLQPEESGESTIPMPTLSTRRSSEDIRKLQRQAEFQIPSVSAEPGRAPTTKLEPDVPSAGQDTFTSRPTEATPDLSSLPRTKIPKNEADSQGGDEHVDDGQINQDVYYSSRDKTKQRPIPTKEAVPEQEEVPEGINTDVFHSSRVSSILSGSAKDDRRKAYEMKMRAAQRTPIDQTRLAEGHDQDTFNVRQTSPTPTPTAEALSPSDIEQGPTKLSEQETLEFAKSLTQDVQNAPSPIPEVSSKSRLASGCFKALMC